MTKRIRQSWSAAEERRRNQYVATNPEPYTVREVPIRELLPAEAVKYMSDCDNE